MNFNLTVFKNRATNIGKWGKNTGKVGDIFQLDDVGTMHILTNHKCPNVSDIRDQRLTIHRVGAETGRCPILLDVESPIRGVPLTIIDQHQVLRKVRGDIVAISVKTRNL